MRKSIAAGLLLALLVPSACHLRQPLLLQPADIRLWRETLERRWSALGSLRAEGSVSLMGEEGSYPGRVALAMKKSGKARADFFDPFGQLKGLVVISGRRLTEYFPGRPEQATSPEATLISGLASAGKSPPAETLASLLLGTPAGLLDGAEIREYGEEEPRTAPAAPAPEVTVFLGAFHGEPVVRKLILRVKGSGESFSLSYDRWALVDGLPMPGRVTIASELNPWSLEMTFKSLEMNVELDDLLFATEPGRDF